MNRAVVRRIAIPALAALGLAASAGCAPVDLNPSPRLGPGPRMVVFAFRDGGEAIVHTLDIGARALPGEFDTYVFVIAGSECASMGPWLPQYFHGLEGVSGPMRLFVIHKRFVADRATGNTGGCSEAFTRADHARRWIGDYTEFIESRLAHHRPRRLVLVGISEGGEVVPALAHRIAGVTHLVLLSSGGMDPMEAFSIQAERFALVGAQAVVSAAKGPAPPDPDAPQDVLGGRSWRYWSELRELAPTSNLLGLDIPILVGMGERDRSMPIEAAWRIRDRFADLGKSNLTVVTYGNADHALFDRDLNRSWLPDFWRKVDRWLDR